MPTAPERSDSPVPATPIAAGDYAEQLKLAAGVSGDTVAEATRIASDAAWTVPVDPEVAKTDLGPLDGTVLDGAASGIYNGDRFDFTSVGLDPIPNLTAIARLLVFGTDGPAACVLPTCNTPEKRRNGFWCVDHEPMPSCENTGACAVDDCPEADGHGPWCKAHHARWYSTGTPLGATEGGRQNCTLPNCAADWFRRGLCKNHHAAAKNRPSGTRLPARTRDRLRRAAVVSCLTTGSDHDRLRATSRWTHTIKALEDEVPHGHKARTNWEREWNAAIEATFEVGGAQLSIAQAKKFNHPNAKSEFDDLMQVSYQGMAEMILSYDPDGAPLSSYAHRAVNDRLREYVWREEHGHLPRVGARNRQRILRTYQKVADRWTLERLSDPDHPAPTETNPRIHQEVSDIIGGDCRPDLVDMVLNPPQYHSYNAPASGRGGNSDAPDMGEWFIAADTDPSAHEAVSYREMLSALGRQMAAHLDDDELDVIVSFDGLLTDGDGEDLQSIGDRYGKTRTWAAAKRKKGLAKLRSPIAIADIAGVETDPSMLSDNRPGGTGSPWLDALTERQRFVARNVLNLGGAALPGSVKDRIVQSAKMMKLDPVEVEHIMYEVLASKPDANDLTGAAAKRAALVAEQAAARALNRSRRAVADARRAVATVRDAVEFVRNMAPSDEQEVLLRTVRKVHRIARKASKRADEALEVALAAAQDAKDGKVTPREAARTITETEGTCQDLLMRVAANATAVETRVRTVSSAFAQVASISHVPTPAPVSIG